MRNLIRHFLWLVLLATSIYLILASGHTQASGSPKAGSPNKVNSKIKSLRAGNTVLGVINDPDQSGGTCSATSKIPIYKAQNDHVMWVPTGKGDFTVIFYDPSTKVGKDDCKTGTPFADSVNNSVAHIYLFPVAHTTTATTKDIYPDAKGCYKYAIVPRLLNDDRTKPLNPMPSDLCNDPNIVVN